MQQRSCMTVVASAIVPGFAWSVAFHKPTSSTPLAGVTCIHAEARGIACNGACLLTHARLGLQGAALMSGEVSVTVEDLRGVCLNWQQTAGYHPQALQAFASSSAHIAHQHIERVLK